MTNIVFSPALQAPITLSNPTGSVSVASDPSTINAKVSPVPPQGSVSLIGAAVKMALAMSTNTGSMSMAGTGPAVISGLVTSRIPLTGAVTSSGTAPTVSQASPTNTLTFPRVMLCGVGGDQSYGCNASTGYPKWTTAAAGSAVYQAVQKIGAYDIAILNGAFEGWDTNGQRDRDDLSKALLKSFATYTVNLSSSRPCLTFYYQIMMEGAASGGPYQQWMNLVQSNNWWLHESTGGAGTITPSGNGLSLINYSAAWPTAIGSAGIGASICGSNYGSLSSGSPTGQQGPARTMGNYMALKYLIRNSAGIDSRFSFNPQMASPSCAGVFLDNVFAALDGSGNVPNSSLDGITLAPGSQSGSFPSLDTPQPVMARGNHNCLDQMQVMVATYQPGSTFYNFGNFGQYANRYQFGTSTLTIGLENTLHGGLLENVIGAAGSSWEYFQQGNPNTGNTNYPSGWPNVLANYYQGMDFCLPPKMVGLGTKLPAIDGSQSASWPVGAGTTLTTIATGTALEYQLMRYGLCTTLLDDGYFAPGVPGGYDWSLLRWYDEYGDDSLAQVNVKRGYLGLPLTTRPTSATWAQGPMGVWSRSFTSGIAIVNPRGNGAQTVTLPGSYTKLTGTQQPTINNGATVSSVSLADGDGLILLGPNGNTNYAWSSIISGNAKSSASGFIAPVVFNNGSAANKASYQGGMIFPVSAACTVDMYFERILGETGSISITVSTFNSTNATAGTHYTALSGTTLTWGDGEIGWKKVSIPVLSIPTGFGLVGISMTGAAAWRPNAWLWLRGTGRVPGAKFFQSSNGVNISPSSTAGAGTLASPWTSLTNAIAQVGNAGGVIYWMQNGTGGHMEWLAGSSGGGNPGALGVVVNNVNATLSSPLIIVPDPGNTSPAFMDQGSTGGGTSIVYSNAFGINFQSNSANVWLCGIHFHRCNINWNPGLNHGAAGNGINNVIWQCEVENFSTDQSNGAGIRFDSNTNLIVQDTYLHENYSTEGGGSTSNPYTSVPSKLENGAEGFGAIAPVFAHCFTHWQQFGIFNKQAPSSGLGFDIKHCYGDYFSANGSGSGAFCHFPVQGPNWSNTVVRYNVCDATGSTVNNDLFCGNEASSTTSTAFDIYNCVQIHNGGMVGPFYSTTGMRLFNSISQSSIDTEMKIGGGAQLLFAGYNIYVSPKQFSTSYGSGTQSFAFASWQTQPAGTYLAQSNPDATSISTTTPPSYTSQSTHDYRFNDSGGRAGRPRGVGNERVGIVNNFLNTSLPVAP